MNSEYYKHELIRELRKAAGLTQAELADRVNLTSVSISRIETGCACSFDNVCRIANALGVPWWRLLRIAELEGILQAA